MCFLVNTHLMALKKIEYPLTIYVLIYYFRIDGDEYNMYENSGNTDDDESITDDNKANSDEAALTIGGKFDTVSSSDMLAGWMARQQE